MAGVKSLNVDDSAQTPQHQKAHHCMKRSSLKHWLTFFSLAVLSNSLAQAQLAGPGSALSLDGTTGFIQVTNGVWFSGDFTVEGWVFVRSYNSWSHFFDFGNGPKTNNVLLALTGGDGGIPVFGVYTNNNEVPSIQSSTQLPTNQWVHLAATLNGTTGTIYINGVNVASGTLNLPPAVTRTRNYFGRSSYETYANALFDELRIWNVARTQGQIQANMHRSLVGNEPGLIGYWRTDEGAGTTLTDSSGNGQTATLFGGTTWTNSTAPLIAGGGSALNFSSTNCQTVQIPNQAALDAYPLTVMTWFMVPTNSDGGALVNKYVSSSGNGWQIFLAGDLRAWYFRDGANNVFNNGVMDAGPVNDGLWHHAAMAVDAAGGRLYLDGVLKSSIAWSGTPGATTTTQPLSFGIYPGDSCFTGQMDEVSIWNTALSTAQIQAAMNHPFAGTEPGLIGYWRLDEGSGTNTVDSSGHGNNGKLLSSPPPAWIASPAPIVVSDPGYGLHFNGSNSYADIPGFANVIPTSEITIEFWQRVAVLQNQSTLSVNPDNVTDRINVHVPWSDGSVYWDFGNIATAGRLSYTPSPSIIGTWNHFAFVASQSGNYMAIYQNGVQVARKAGMTPFTRSGQHLILGAIPSGVYFNGDLDEVRIWNVARSAAQISGNFKSTLVGNETGLVAYYRLDEGSGTNLVDAIGNGYNGTLVNNPTWLVTSEPASGPILLGGNITTSGGQHYTSRVLLTNDTVLTSTGGGAITFDSTVDGPYSLTANTAGTTAFSGAVGDSSALASLTTDAAGTTTLNGGSVTTSGSQTYGDPITLGAGATLTTTGAGTITFANTIDGAFSLTVNTAGPTAFNGVVGGLTPLASLATDLAGTTLLNSGSVTTAGSQTYADAVQLGVNNTATSTGVGNITFGNTLNGSFGLTVNTAGTNSFNGAVGGLTALTSLTTSPAGTTVFNGGSVTTTGSQTYNDAVQFKLTALTVTSTGGGNIIFNTTIAGLDLRVNTAGTTIFNAPVGPGLLSLTTDAAGTTLLNGGSVSTGGSQSYGDRITLGAGTTLSANTVTFGNTVDGAFDLTVNAPGTAFNGAVGNFTPLASLTISSGGMTSLSGGSVITSGSQFYRNPITLGAGTTLTSTGGGAITCADTVNGSFSLTVNTSGTTSFNGAIGGSIVIPSLTITGPAAINGNLVITTGSQAYGGTFRLGENTTLTSTGAGNITFADTVTGAYSLTVNTAGTTAFNGQVTPNSLTTDAPGTTLLNCGTVATLGSQTYGDAVTLGSNTMLFSSVGNITFASTVDGAFGLTLSVPGTTAFNAHVGGTGALASLNTVQRGGSTLFSGGSVVTLGTQTYYDRVVLGADTTLTGTSLAFLGASGTSLSGNNHALTLANSDDSVLNFFANSTSSGVSSLLLNGRLLTVSGTLSANTVIVNNGATLGGNGTIVAAVAVSSGGTLSPGSSIGTLTVSNSLSLSGTALMELSPAGATNDQVRGITLLTYGGTLWLTNLDGTVLAAGNSFKLFSAATYGGAFTNYLLPSLSNGLVWDSSKLAIDGTIAVIHPPPISRITAIKPVAPHTIQLAGTGVASQIYYIRASTNLALPLAQWWLLGATNSASSGQIGFTDITATNDHRFYRLAQ